MTTPVQSPSQTFDPFGERIVLSSACEAPARPGGGLWSIGAVVFWTIALVLVAGRIYVSDVPAASSVVATSTATTTVVR